MDRAALQRALLAGLLVLAVVLCLPLLHALVGVDTVDAFDQGVSLPRLSSHGQALAVVACALFILSISVTTTLSRITPSVVSAARHETTARAGTRRTHTHVARRTCAPDDADGVPHHAASSIEPVIPALRLVLSRTQTEGLSFCLAPASAKEGNPATYTSEPQSRDPLGEGE